MSNSETRDYNELREKPSLFVESILGVEPFDYQKEFLDNGTRHRVVASGRQVGKSRMAAWLALHYALTHPYSHVLVTAPSLRQSSLLFDTVYTEIQKSGLSNEEWGIERDTQTILEFDNSSDIHVVPTGRDGSNIRGHTADLIIVDEAAFIKELIFEDILEPMTFATGGRMVLASTPYGTSGYFYNKFNTAPNNSKWARLQVSSHQNPVIDDEDLEEFKKGKTEIQIKREVLGEFAEDSDQFFPNSAIRRCMDGGQPTQKADSTYLGVDIAGSGSDQTVLHGVDADGNVFLHNEAHDNMGPIDAVDYMKKLDRQFDFNKILVDRTAIGEGTIETLSRDPQMDRKVEDIFFSLPKKQQLYQRLKAALGSDFIHLPNDKTLRKELKSIATDSTKTGQLRFNAKSDGDFTGRDDYVDSLALAVFGIPEFGNSTGRPSEQNPQPVFGTQSRQTPAQRSRRRNRNKSTSQKSGPVTINKRPNRRSNRRSR